MDKKICIITGANSGIGKEAVLQILDKGYHVIMACRSERRGVEALKSIGAVDSSYSVELMLVDMGIQKSVRDFAEKVKDKYNKIDVLIHNAAIFNVTQKVQEKTLEGIETVWATNHLGPVLLTELLLENLKSSDNGRVLTVSSQGLVAMPTLKVDLEDPEFTNRKFSIVKAYYQSKRAQVMYTYWMAERLKDTNITVNSIRVTAVQIDISRHPDISPFSRWVYSIKSKMSLTALEMAETYTYLATSLEVKHTTGKYFNEKQQEVKSNKYSYKKENIEAVMELTVKYIKDF